MSTKIETTTTETVQVTSKYPDSNAVIAYLAEKFPLCFSLTEPKPLKIGIFQDLAENLQADPDLSNTKLRQAVRKYTSSWAYLSACQAGANRVDLKGEHCGELDQQQAEHAAQRLAESKAIVAERQAARKAKLAEERKRQAKARHTPAKKRKPKKPALTSVNLAELQLNTKVKIKAGAGMQAGTVLEIVRDGARIELDNGLVVTVNKEHLYL